MSEIFEGSLNGNDRKPKSSPLAKVFIGLTGGLGLGLSILALPFLTPALRKYCLPFVPATSRQIDNVLELLPKKPQSSSRLLDIGSGDGRIVMAASKTGLEAHGVEINLPLVLYSKIKSHIIKTPGKVKFFRRDLWKFNVTEYDYIVIFGVEQMMDNLELKLKQELKADSKVIACRFPLPNMNPIKMVGHGVDTVWLYNFNKTLENYI